MGGVCDGILTYYSARQATTCTVVFMDERHQHAHRFRKVSNRYIRRLAERYDGDTRTITDVDDDVVAATVAARRKAQGLTAVDWQTVQRV
jgi:hypothetical protein